jgi:DNA polymerase-3 subunit alpha
LKPKNVLELSHVNAIARPTALAYEKPYIDNSAECPHPIFESALNWTRNLPLYQEQTIMLVKALGFSDDESEQFRRVAAKKKTDEIKEWVDKINSNIKRKGLSEDITKFLLKLIGDSANYQFNLAHSVSTSYLTALTVYLKYKYPLEFYWACLNEVKEKPNSNELIGQIFSELKQMGIELLSPNILKSETDFTIEKNGIRFGLGNLKGLGEKAINKLQEFKDEFQNPFEIFSGALESGLNFTSMSSLIQSGSMDDFIKNGRCYTVLELGLWKELTPRERKKILIDQLGEKFNYDLVSIVKSLSKTENVELKPFIKESRLETLRKDFKPYNDMYKLNIKNEPLANYMAEKTYLGYSYSQNLFNILKKEYYDLVSIYEAKTELPEQKVTVGGEVLEYREGKSKNNNRYIKAKISDSTGETDIMLMEKYFEKNDEMNNGRKLQIGDIVCAIGRTSKDIIFCDRIVNQNVKIAHTPAQLKNIN